MNQYSHFRQLFNVDKIAAFQMTFKVDTNSTFNTIETPWILTAEMRTCAWDNPSMSRISESLKKSYPGWAVKDENDEYTSVGKMAPDESLVLAYIADAITSLTELQYLGSIWTKTIAGEMRILNPQHIVSASHKTRTGEWATGEWATECEIPEDYCTTGPLFFVEPMPKGISGHK